MGYLKEMGIATMYFKRVWFRTTLRKDAIFWLGNAATSLILTVRILWVSKPIPWWLVAPLIIVFLVSVLLLIFHVLDALRLPYSDIWLNSRGARKWLKPRLGDRRAGFSKYGVGEIFVIGTACTDIVDLFEEVVDARRSHISFTVMMLDPEGAEIKKIIQWENPKDVREFVQEPLTRSFEKLASRYETKEFGEIANALRGLKGQLEKTGFVNHSECIKVCRETWKLAGRASGAQGCVKIYLLKHLAFARQWVVGRTALLYSPYIGHPGVGVDNPVFCHSDLEGEAGLGPIGDRALDFVASVIEECGSPWWDSATSKEMNWENVIQRESSGPMLETLRRLLKRRVVAT